MPLDAKFSDLNLAEANGFLRVMKKPIARLPSKGS
jgi:hypothetical protein